MYGFESHRIALCYNCAIYKNDAVSNSFGVFLLWKYITALLHQRAKSEPHTVHEGELIF